MSDETRSRIAHLHRRAGFGIDAAALDAAVPRGYADAVESLVAPVLPDGPADALSRPQLPPGADELVANVDPGTRRARVAATEDMVAWWLDRMVVTTAPLVEKMTLLWHGHFATSIDKVKDPALMLAQNELFRRLGLGSFEALTQAVARDPAMLRWLDSNTNKRGHPNENFGRELLELFTLGIGAYTESDVKEVARCFTGWGADRAGSFVFRPGLHDAGPKTVLGVTRSFDGGEVVSVICRSEMSARFVTAKLWSHLARPIGVDDPVVRALATSFAANLDVRALIRSILLHADFVGAPVRSGLVKQPVAWLAGSLRVLGLRAAAVKPSPSAALRSLGQLPFAPPSVGGWPQNSYWLSTASALARLQVARGLAHGADLSALANVPPSSRPAALARTLSLDAWSPSTAAALAAVAGDVRNLVTVGLTAPEYVMA